MNRCQNINGCGTAAHFNRRTFLGAASAAAGLTWLTPLAGQLARAEAESPRGAPAKSVIVLWMQGGPSQLETFDPHPGTNIAAGSKARPTSVKGVLLGDGCEQVADLMHEMAIVRSVVSKEGDHERATYNMKTGYRPDPTLVHPSIGAIMCHQLPDTRVEIPRHVSILPGQWPARGGYLGAQFDAFKTNDPAQPVPDVRPRVSQQRFDEIIGDLENVIEPGFARGRLRNLDHEKTLHMSTLNAAVRMMSSAQLKAFDVTLEPEEVQAAFGDHEFGRGCLAALRLIEVGVRCVEVTLNGWDTHINNHEGHAEQLKILDPALAALIRGLIDRDLLDSTIVLCGGEFGRTPGRPGSPGLNGTSGRDHWPHGFSVALAGGGLRKGVTVGATSPDPKMDKTKVEQDVESIVHVADIHATVLQALGVNYSRDLQTPIGRPLAISEGRPIQQLLPNT